MTPIIEIIAIRSRLVDLLRNRATTLIRQRLLGAVRSRVPPAPIKKPTHPAPKMLQ